MRDAYLEELHVICLLPKAFEALRYAIKGNKTVVRRISSIRITAQHPESYIVYIDTDKRVNRTIATELNLLVACLNELGFSRSNSTTNNNDCGSHYDMKFFSQNLSEEKNRHNEASGDDYLSGDEDTTEVLNRGYRCVDAFELAEYHNSHPDDFWEY